MKKLIHKIKSLIRTSKPNEKTHLKGLIENEYLIVGKNTIFKDVFLDIRNRSVNKTFLKIGIDSFVKGKFIFENEFGHINIGDRTFIGGGRFIAIDNIDIGSDVLISWGCTFMDNDAHSIDWKERKNDVAEWKRGVEENKIGLYKNWESVRKAPIIIKDKAWVGFEVVILKGVTVGEGAVIGSKSVVTKDVPDWTIVAGNPTQIIRQIPEEDR